MSQLAKATTVTALLLHAGMSAQAQPWTPSKNVEIVVPSSPGGTNDKLARQLERTINAAKLAPSVAVVHRSGAGGQLAYTHINQHTGDAHYLVVVPPTMLTAHITGTSKLNYTDFTPIALVFNDHMVYVVNAASAMKSGKDFAARLRADAQTMPFGFAAGLGNHHHIAAGLFMKAIGGNARALKPVVFKGSPEAVTALLGAHLEWATVGAANAAPHAETGKLRMVGITAPRRLPGAMGNAPTWREQGIDLVYGSWRAILAPRALSPDQIAFWENALRKAVDTAEWKAELERYYWSDYFTTGPALVKNLEREYTESRAVLVELGLSK